MDKKISPSTPAGKQIAEVSTLPSENTTSASFSQHLDYLPEKILNLPRFVPTRTDKPKAPFKGWQKAENQHMLHEIKTRPVGFIAAVETGDLLFLDFDHVLDDNGEFVNDNAARWYNFIVSACEIFYCERSVSRSGLHIFLKPTQDKFDFKIGKLTLDAKTECAIEIFYKTNKNCLVTGELFNCPPNAPIIEGDVADAIFQAFINDVNKQKATLAKSQSAREPVKNCAELGNDYDLFRAVLMLDAINPAEFEKDSDWFAVISAAKNIGIDYATVDAWNLRDSKHYNEVENKTRWDSVKDPSFNIATLHGIAKRFGYSEKDARRQWYDLYPELKTSYKKNADEKIKRELDDAIIWLESLDAENFTAADALDENNIRKVALAIFYGKPEIGEIFFNTIATAKNAAKKRLAVAESGLTAPLSQADKNQLTALKNGVNVYELRKRVKSAVTVCKKEQTYFEDEEKHKAAQAELERRRAKQAAQDKANTDRLKELLAAPQSKERDAEIISVIRELCDWKHDKLGNPVAVRATAANINLILGNDPHLKDLIGYDEFQQADVFLKAPVWKPDAKKGDEWTDRDDSQLQMYLRNTYTEYANKELTLNAVTTFSDARRFHEVKEFFSNLPAWDLTPRAEKLFVKFLGADDTPYVREVTLNILTAAVARIFHPGCDYQLAPILVGEQGIGKSYLLGKLFGKWYGSLVDDVGDPHAIDAIQKLWGVEIKEMAAMKKDVDANKRFIDSAKDTRRQAYARRATTVPRHCVFLITTNNKMCLTDMTGNRRYPIIVCHNMPRHYVEGLTNTYIQQVWAEVFAHYNELFKDGFDEKKLELSRPAQIQSDEIAEDYLRDDGMESEICAYLDTKILPDILWRLLTRDERRKFFVEGGLHMTDAVSEFNHRRRARGGRADTVQRDVDKISDWLEGVDGKNYVRTTKSTQGGETVPVYHIYGSEQRKHICAVEIFNECFGNDKRKTPTRINEILNRIDGWSLGANIARDDPAYLRQRKVFYRE